MISRRVVMGTAKLTAASKQGQVGTLSPDLGRRTIRNFWRCFSNYLRQDHDAIQWIEVLHRTAHDGWSMLSVRASEIALPNPSFTSRVLRSGSFSAGENRATLSAMCASTAVGASNLCSVQLLSFGGIQSQMELSYISIRVAYINGCFIRLVHPAFTAVYSAPVTGNLRSLSCSKPPIILLASRCSTNIEPTSFSLLTNGKRT